MHIAHILYSKYCVIIYMKYLYAMTCHIEGIWPYCVLSNSVSFLDLSMFSN